MLSKILENKLLEIDTLEVPTFERQKEIFSPLEFLRNRPIIAEVKKASPSLGDINTNINVVEQAKIYEKAGAGAVSVLTDEKFFKGGFTYLQQVACQVKIPVLCKDFIISKKQIDIAYKLGADIILLIVKALSEKEYVELFNYAKSLGLYVLTEIHEKGEITVAEKAKIDLLGVNSRNLETLKIDKNKCAEIISSLPKDYFKVAESGISSKEDVLMFKAAGANAFLIGSYLMQSKSPGENIKEILKCL
jgi:indole-3-glycerol phosphate synthase